MSFHCKPNIKKCFLAPARGDELESLFYLIIYLKEGYLAWDEPGLTFKEVHMTKEIFFATLES